MIHHSKAVARSCKSPFLVGDLPFGSYERSPEWALDNAVRYIREGKVESVKMEGGQELFKHVEKLTQWGIPVVGHVGLTPQRHVSLGGYKVQGKSFEKVFIQYL
jgi:3-methyl-2-oxobutanoate hydroxymethyltransferase